MEGWLLVYVGDIIITIMTEMEHLQKVDETIKVYEMMTSKN